MQNLLNQEHAFRESDALRGCAFTREDDGFYRSSITRCIERAHDLPVVEAFIEIADHIHAHRATITDAFCSMPFGWLYHDFREIQIIGDPPRLIDWGSSYGHGPFLFDFAPFLVNDERGLAAFFAHSDICRSATEDEIERCLHAANCAHFAGFTLWRLSDPPVVSQVQTREGCRALLAYEYPAYRRVIEHILGVAWGSRGPWTEDVAFLPGTRS